MHSMRRLPTPLVLLVALQVGACTTWMPSAQAPGPLIADEAPERLRVTNDSGERVVLIAPQIQADSLVGTNESVALTEVTQLEIRRLNHAATVVGLLAITLVGVIVYGATSFSCCASGLGGS